MYTNRITTDGQPISEIDESSGSSTADIFNEVLLNKIEQIKDDAGDYIILTDYGSDGIAVSHQCKTLQEALDFVMGGGGFGAMSCVKLLRWEAKEKETL